ncbi:hypothetical protein HFP89_13580 [Wenzhouxiangella sp. XN79A]|uniref:hypothetical protein n=1 Tax=Wenzhouxiangella sp. XN79A TaxID=2724193 RepID=UPI00144A67F1|nr:hypothetical protein [Wenzhouxiangella sp. XN79A]NKI36196.1 hypothetical protein [Wenzhouxiangella sp. XN79A]
MDHRINRLAALVAGLGLCLPALAAIDPFTVAQGPLTAGPGEEIAPELGVIDAPGVLGGFRIMAPAMGDEAPAGSFSTVAAGGGQWDCVIDVAQVDPVTANGGCSTGWDRSEGALFDFSMVDTFDLDVLEVTGVATLALQVVDGDETLASAFVENLAAGPLQIPRSAFFPLTFGEIDWAAIDSLSLVVINGEGADARVRIGALGATGVIPGAQDPPPGPSDAELSDTVSGNWFSPSRSGEGCQLTREADASTFILTCYVYRAGGQVWMIGTGALVDGRIVSDNMVITRGAQYGALFDPDEVERLPFGTVSIDFADCNSGSVSMSPTIDGFAPVLLPMQRIVPVACDQGVPDPVNAVRAGNWFDPQRSGEGFQLAPEGSSGLHVITYYTYLDGEPAWLIGTGTIAGNRIEFADVVVTSGTGFGADFEPDEVVRTPFGRLIVEFDDCNNASMLVDADLPAFADQNLDLTRIVQGTCP